MQVFSDDEDRNEMLRLLSQQLGKYDVQTTAWCLMPNHLHLILVPGSEDSLPMAVGTGFHGYSCYFNERTGESGRLFQGRYFSAPMDEVHAFCALRYILNNPVKARIATDAWNYKWSSARFCVGMTGTDPLLQTSDIPPIGDWDEFLSVKQDEVGEKVEQNTLRGRPSVSSECLESIQQQHGIRIPRWTRTKRRES